MSEFFEMLMVVAFGISWPMKIVKSLRSKTAKGRSVAFTLLILVGYVCGIVSKLISDKGLTYVFVFYVLNLIMVSIDLGLYFRNHRLDAERDQKNA